MSEAHRSERKFPTGTILDDRFEIKKFIGSGSFGDVYLAQQLVFGHRFRDVALKLFKSDCVNSGNVSEVLNDAIVLVSLLDDNPPPEVSGRIVKVLDMGTVRTPEQRAYMCMELIAGGNNLERQIRNNRDGGMPVDLSLYYLMEILKPLSWMHDNQVVHGDLKPDNVLISPENQIVLTDFGLAARIPIGVLGGAIAYQAPEVLRGQGGEQAADVFALGAMWYEMLTACQPFSHVGLEELENNDTTGYIRAQLEARKWPIKRGERNVPPEEEQRIPPASEVNPELRKFPQIEIILNRCLSFRENERFTSAGMLERTIEEYKKTGKIDVWLPDKQDCKENGPAENTEVSVSSNSPEFQVANAETFIHKKEFSKASEILNELLQQNDSFIPAILCKAKLQAEKGLFEEAQKTVENAMNLSPRNPDVFETLAMIAELSGQRGYADNMHKLARKYKKQNK